jgi:DNA-binding GntR family transcriptional regulator
MGNDSQFRYRNLPDQLADHIVELLAKGDLAAGQRLYEKEICELLGVSRIPVREALRILQAQGVVRTEPNRGTFITEFGDDEIAEVLEVRLSVERIALRRLLKMVPGNPEILDELNAAIDEMRKAAKLSDQLSYCRADLGFHAKIVELSMSLLLKPIWESLSRTVLVFLMREKHAHFDYPSAIQDHERLLELIASRKRAALEQEIERHITNSLANPARAANAARSQGSYT